jgi:predicted 3-demethylubiquinone-9 3-methyltransferase (glyoxalase superfamily)
MPRITPNLWFVTEALQAAEFYTSIFPSSRITELNRYPDGTGDLAGKVLTVTFELDGQEYTALNGGPQVGFNEAISMLITCDDQEEVDYYWAKLLEGGGEEQRLGWLKDRFGLSWQVVPAGMDELLASLDPAASRRAMSAMADMKKLDMRVLLAAAEGR